MKEYIEANKDRFLAELFELIRIPSISSEPEHKPDMQRCAERWCQLLLQAGADSAPNWYVRHGMRDRDTSFALQTVLAYALSSNDDVDLSMMSFEFAWLKGHQGDYDVQEAYAWLKSVL